MSVRITNLIFVLLLLFMTACNSSETSPSPANPTPTYTSAPTLQPTPDAGKSTLIGRLVSKKTNQPLVNTFVRLAEVVRQGDEGAFVLDIAFSPGATSDENGNFVFNNVEAKEYVMVVGDVYDKYEIILGDDGKAKAWEATADQVVDVGDILVDSLP